MRSAIALAIFATLATGCASNRTWDVPAVSGDYVDVAYFHIEVIGVESPAVHLYFNTKGARDADFSTAEKLHTTAADGSHLHFQQGYRGFGVLLATFTGDAARRLLDAIHSPEALDGASGYHLIGDNSNEWAINRLKQAGLWTEELADAMPWGAIE